MVFKNRRLNKKWFTVDASEEVGIELKFLKIIDRFKPHGFFDLDVFFFFLHWFILHIYYNPI